jgi:two-component system OmpR family sensor kinase
MVVRDTGVGIAPENLPLVFERFYRADPARSSDPGGTGLGLSIARWIVKQHEGEILLDSQLGKGTTVIVRLPLCLCP